MQLPQTARQCHSIRWALRQPPHREAPARTMMAKPVHECRLARAQACLFAAQQPPTRSFPCPLLSSARRSLGASHVAGAHPAHPAPVAAAAAAAAVLRQRQQWRGHARARAALGADPWWPRAAASCLLALLELEPPQQQHCLRRLAAAASRNRALFARQSLWDPLVAFACALVAAKRSEIRAHLRVSLLPLCQRFQLPR